MVEMVEQDKKYVNTVEVRVTVEVFDHYNGGVYRDESRSFKTSSHCITDAVSMNYDDNVDNMKLWALEDAIKAVKRGYGR